MSLLTTENPELYFSRVQAELLRFDQLSTAVIDIYGGTQLFDDVYLLGHIPPPTRSPSPGQNVKQNVQQSEKKYPCVFGAITHGNEISGLVSLNLFLEALSLHEIVLDFPIVVMLGNRQAALLGKRYVDADLNRSFAQDSTQYKPHYYEHQRAKDLATILSDSAYLLDIHQTIGFSPKGFYIFAYSEPCFHFARNILPYQDIVTYWSGAYTTEGVCSDQFVCSHGGVGVTLELGTKGFENYQAALGFQALLATQGYVRRFHIYNQPHSMHLHTSSQQPHIYTWNAVVPYPPTGEVKPRPNLNNFDQICQGDILGESSTLGNIVAPADGLALFPSRIHCGAHDTKPRPHELIRILKAVSITDLPVTPKHSVNK